MSKENNVFMSKVEDIINGDAKMRCPSQDVAIPFTTIYNDQVDELFRKNGLNNNVSIAYEMINPPEKIVYFSYKDEEILSIKDSSDILNILKECIKQNTNIPAIGLSSELLKLIDFNKIKEFKEKNPLIVSYEFILSDNNVTSILKKYIPNLNDKVEVHIFIDEYNNGTIRYYYNKDQIDITDLEKDCRIFGAKMPDTEFIIERCIRQHTNLPSL